MTALVARSGVVLSSLTPRRLLSLAVAVALAVAYLRWTPLSPDLAAQVARADVTRQVGNSSWWTGWFGGISMPSYSVLVPSSMAALGVQMTGLIAATLGAIAGAKLMTSSIRPRAGTLAFALSSAADLLVGRVTFVVGASIAVWALVALRDRRTVVATGLAAASYFASPLAALFLGLVFVAVAVTEPTRRRGAVVAATVVLLLAAAMAALFPGTGTMPFSLLSALVPALCCLAVLVLCRQKVVRLTAALAVVATIVCVFLPGAVGSNITRLAWIAAAPLVVAYARLPRRWMVVSVVVVVAAWPLIDTAGQLHSANNPSTQAAYYEPVAAALTAQRQGLGAAATGERVEVVDTVDHWGSVYLAGQSLARGWDRQADNTDNPIFYKNGALDAASYRKWLDQLAVGWVALPAAPLDFASVAEGKLVRSGLPYLRLTFASADWRLYRVLDPTSLASGATVDSIDADSVTITTNATGTAHLRLRWSPYLAATDPSTGQAVAACVLDENGWLGLYLPEAETVSITSNFTVATRLRSSDADCEQDLAAGEQP